MSAACPPIVPRIPEIDLMSVIIVVNISFVSKNRRKSFVISDKNINFTRILKIN